MRTWTFSINALPEYRYGMLHMIEWPWWLALIDWCSDTFFSIAEDCLNHVPLPDWFPKERDDTDTTKYTLREWYGNLGDMVHVHIHSPILERIWEHPKRKEYNIEVGYDKIKELFYEMDKKFFDEAEKP